MSCPEKRVRTARSAGSSPCRRMLSRNASVHCAGTGDLQKTTYAWLLRVETRGGVGLSDVDFVEDFLLGQDARRRLRAAEDAIDDVLVGREPVLLEPEDDVGLARQRTDLDLLGAADHLRRHA